MTERGSQFVQRPHLNLIFVQHWGQGPSAGSKNSTYVLDLDHYCKLFDFLAQAVKREAQWKTTPFTKPETIGAVIVPASHYTQGYGRDDGVRLSLRREGPNQIRLVCDQTGDTFVTRNAGATRQLRDAVGAVIVWLSK